MSLNEDRRKADKIRRLARKAGLLAKKDRRPPGLWYFINHNNFLVSPETGLFDDEAVKFLKD